LNVTLDFETTTKNKGHPFTPENFAVSYSIQINNENPTFHYFTDLDFLSFLRQHIGLCTCFIGFNCKFDLHWLRRLGLALPPGCKIFDCSLAEFIVTGQEASYASLDGCLESYGLPLKQDKVKEFWDVGVDTKDIPYEILEEYNNLDVSLTYQLYLQQLQILDEKQLKLVFLEGEDMKTLLEAEYNGVKWDVEGAKTALEGYKNEVVRGRAGLWDFVPQTAQKYFNWESGDDLSLLLYGGEKAYDDFTEEDAVYKSGEKKGTAYIKRSWFQVPCTFSQRFKPIEGTTVKKCLKEGYSGPMYYQVDEPTLKQLTSRRKEDKQLIDLLLSVAKTQKIVEMLEELFKVTEKFGWQDDLLHGQFNQNVVRTGRLSSSQPNMQNKPPELDMFLVSRYAG